MQDGKGETKMTHDWKTETCSSPFDPPEYYIHCNECGTEQNDENMSEECEILSCIHNFEIHSGTDLYGCEQWEECTKCGKLRN